MKISATRFEERCTLGSRGAGRDRCFFGAPWSKATSPPEKPPESSSQLPLQSRLATPGGEGVQHGSSFDLRDHLNVLFGARAVACPSRADTYGGAAWFIF